MISMEATIKKVTDRNLIYTNSTHAKIYVPILSSYIQASNELYKVKDVILQSLITHF